MNARTKHLVCEGKTAFYVAQNSTTQFHEARIKACSWPRSCVLSNHVLLLLAHVNLLLPTMHYHYWNSARAQATRLLWRALMPGPMLYWKTSDHWRRCVVLQGDDALACRLHDKRRSPKVRHPHPFGRVVMGVSICHCVPEKFWTQFFFLSIVRCGELSTPPYQIFK